MKHKRLTYWLFLILLLQPFFVVAQKISVSIFNEVPLSSLLITPSRGQYRLIMDDTSLAVATNQLIYITRVGDSISVRDASCNLGVCARVALVGLSGNDLLRVKPIMPSLPARLYDDNMNFYIDYNRIMAINLIEQEKYVAAVVEAEGGYNRALEFYRAQAILVRTYLYANLHRHAEEGFNLCDAVHCQAYKGRSESNRVFDATSDTRDLIIVDSEGKPIAAAFHANCGGHTANSGDVWVSSMPYLIGVPDRFCSGGRGAVWQQRVPLSKWYKFLSLQGVDTSRITTSDLNFTQKTRQKYYVVNGVSIQTTKVREYFKLKSAWFNVSVHRNEVRLAGRGYGHGVGLCQEGAMAMAAKGWTYERIIDYYYKDVRIVNSSSLHRLNDGEITTNQNDTLSKNQSEQTEATMRLY